jgi:hypothetical protein
MKNSFFFYFFLTLPLLSFAAERNLILPTGTLVVYASQSGEPTMDGINAGDKNSPFTAALLENLSNMEDINFVLRKVRQKVLDSTEQRQQPLTQETFTAGSLILANINNGYPKKIISNALIIGNSKYKSVTEIKNPENDATAIAKLLFKLNFTVSTSIDRSKEELISDISKFQDNSKNSDVTLLFFAGHGIQISGKNYILPIDVTANSESSVRESSLSIEEIIKKLPGKTRLVFVDADSDNPFSSKSTR